MNTATHLASFNGTPIEIIDHHGQPWLTGEQIGRAIGIKHARKGIHSIYTRHADEFTTQMSTVLNLGTVDRKVREVRVYSPRGAWMIAMWAQTDQAKQFRVWVLDVLEKQSELAGQEKPPEAKPHAGNTVQVDQVEYIGLLKSRIAYLEGRRPGAGRPAPRPLTDQEKARIIELRGQGRQTMDIARAVGRSRSAVRSVIRENAKALPQGGGQ